MLVGILVEIAQILAGGLLVTTEVIVRTVGNAPQLAPVGERKGVFDIRGGTGVEGELGLLMVAQAQMLLFDAEGAATSGSSPSSRRTTRGRSRACRRTRTPSAQTRGCGR